MRIMPAWWAAVRAFDSVGVSVAGFCLLKFGTVLRDDQRINGEFFCLVTQPQLESIREQRLNPQSNLLPPLVGRKFLQFFDERVLLLRVNIVSFGVDPAWSSRNLKVFNVVRDMQ